MAKEAQPVAPPPQRKSNLQRLCAVLWQLKKDSNLAHHGNDFTPNQVENMLIQPLQENFVKDDSPEQRSKVAHSGAWCSLCGHHVNTLYAGTVTHE